MQQALVLAALALVLAVAAVLLWRHANMARAAPRVPPSWKTRLRARDVPIGGATFAGGRAARSGFSWWDRLLLLAGLRHGAGLYLRIFAPIVAARCWPGPSWAPCPASSRCCY